MRKISTFGMTAAAMGALGWMAAAQAQTAPEGTPAPTSTMPAPAAPAPTPAPAAPAPSEAAPAAPAPSDQTPAAGTSAPDTSSTAAPEEAKPAKMKPMHHKMKGMKHDSVHRGSGGDAAVDDLNAKSLAAAKSGTSFAPATTPTAAPMKAKSMKPMHHHHMKKKPAAEPAAPDATPAPADSGSK